MTLTKKWQNRFFALAATVATWSKDKKVGVGCVVVDKNRKVLSLGYNGFPAGVNDCRVAQAHRYDKPLKLLYTEHAERNAIFTAGRNGVSLEGGLLFSTLYPCADCARAIIQAGIKEVYTTPPHSESWAESHQAARQMFDEAGITIKMIL